jgi:molybdate transport system substrate-binding protein
LTAKSTIAGLALVTMLSPAGAAELAVLSAGAVEPGLAAFAKLVKQETGHDLRIQYNTTPRITQRLAAGETYDLLIAPPAVIEQGAKEGKVVADTRAAIGRVGAGVVVRQGAAVPDVATVDALKQALLAAESIVYNTASTGLYLEKLFDRMGLSEALKAKTTRYPDGAAVIEHVIRGKGNEIGFGAITEIRLYESKGARLVGPLPADVQNYTSYAAGVMTGARAPEAAKAVLALAATPAGKAAFGSGGVE